MHRKVRVAMRLNRHSESRNNETRNNNKSLAKRPFVSSLAFISFCPFDIFVYFCGFSRLTSTTRPTSWQSFAAQQQRTRANISQNKQTKRARNSCSRTARPADHRPTTSTQLFIIICLSLRVCGVKINYKSATKSTKQRKYNFLIVSNFCRSQFGRPVIDDYI